jgi:hypothetical protein
MFGSSFLGFHAGALLPVGGRGMVSALFQRRRQMKTKTFQGESEEALNQQINAWQFSNSVKIVVKHPTQESPLRARATARRHETIRTQPRFSAAVGYVDI